MAAALAAVAEQEVTEGEVVKVALALQGELLLLC